MKKILFSILTLIVIVASNFFLSKLFNLPFLELAFMTGLAFTIIIGYFSSEGGFFTEMLDNQYKRFMDSESRTKSHFVNFNISLPFIVSLLYTLVSSVISVFAYWKYFV